MNIEQTLQTLEREDMARLLARLYGIHRDMDEIIESHIASAVSRSENDGELVNSLSRRIVQLVREHTFVDYRHSLVFSQRLEALLMDINSLLRQQDPVQALKLTEQFLALIPEVMNRCDDSCGSIGEVFRQGADQWLDIAVQVRKSHPEHTDWTQRLRDYHQNNDYGCLDNIIAHSRHLLTRQELHQLAAEFETQARQARALHTGKGLNVKLSDATLGLRAVAQALDDITLFENSVLLRSPDPNTLQIEQIISFALEIDALERAEYWLAQPVWQQDSLRHTRWTTELLKTKGALGELKAQMLAQFQKQPAMQPLITYCEHATADELAVMRQNVEASLESLHDVGSQIAMLFTVGSCHRAAQCAVNGAASLPTVGYGALLDWAKTFEAEGETLAAVVCYRGLLIDLLKRGYAKAYSHGARYFRALIRLDKQIGDYQGLPDCSTFIRQLREQHGRKRRFWAEVSYPLKP